MPAAVAPPVIIPVIAVYNVPSMPSAYIAAARTMMHHLILWIQSYERFVIEPLFQAAQTTIAQQQNIPWNVVRVDGLVNAVRRFNPHNAYLRAYMITAITFVFDHLVRNPATKYIVDQNGGAPLGAQAGRDPGEGGRASGTEQSVSYQTGVPTTARWKRCWPWGTRAMSVDSANPPAGKGWRHRPPCDPHDSFCSNSGPS